MVLLLLGYPLLEGAGMCFPPLTLLVVATLLFGVDAVSTTRRPVLIALSLSALPFFLKWERVIFGYSVVSAIPFVHYAGMALLLLFYLFVITMLLASILQRQQSAAAPGPPGRSISPHFNSTGGRGRPVDLLKGVPADPSISQTPAAGLNLPMGVTEPRRHGQISA